MSSSLLVSGIGPIYKFEIENDGSELPLDYDVAAMETFFNKRPLEVMYRTGEIFAELLPYFTRAFIWEYLIRSVAGLVQIHYFDTYINEQRKSIRRKIRDHEGLQRRYAVELREMLTRLGPSFIKLGQAVSIR